MLRGIAAMQSPSERTANDGVWMPEYNSDAIDERQLLVAFGAVVSLAEHLAVGRNRATTLFPWSDMVTICDLISCLVIGQWSSPFC